MIASGTLSIFLNKDEFLEKFIVSNDIPKVLFGVDVKGVPSIIIDNKNGLKKAIKHLIVDHNYKKIGFIKDYHTFSDQHGKKDSETIENLLEKIWESPSSGIINEIIEGKFPENKKRALFASFLGISLTRVPYHRENVDKIIEHSALMTLNQIAAIAGFKFRNTGTYQFAILVNGETKATVRLLVNPPKEDTK